MTTNHGGRVPAAAFAAWLNREGVPRLDPRDAARLVRMHDAYLAARDRLPPELADLGDGYDGALCILFAAWERQWSAAEGASA